METVAEKAGVSRPLVYKHFANRSEMLTLLYRREAILVGQEVAAAVREARSLPDMYRALVHAALGASASRGALLQALRTAGAFSRDLRHEQRERDQQTVRFFAARATSELGIPSAQALAVTGMLLTALDSVLGQWRSRRTAPNARLLEDTYMDVVTGALDLVRQRSGGPAAAAAGGGI